MTVMTSIVIARRSLQPDAAVLTVQAEGAAAVRPFQFYMLSCPDSAAFPFLPRPFSVYDAGSRSLDFLVKSIGPGTAALAELELGDELLLTGPLGNGIDLPPFGRRSIGVAGGVGIAPFLLLYRRMLAASPPSGGERPLLIFGARSREFLYDLELFEDLPIDLRIATEDGSLGTRGLVTDLLAPALDEEPSEVLACGPDRMMAAVARVCARAGMPCRLSLETFMACGVGICNACAVKVRDDRFVEGYRYDRCCIDGPVFDAAQVEEL
jgi:dihydroorotate dehydrogenase electron transfer subunit